MQKILGDKTTMQYLPTMIHYGDSIDFIKKRRETWDHLQANDVAFMLHIVVKATNKVIGCCVLKNFDWVNSSAEVGIIIDKDFHKQKISTEVHLHLLEYGFENLNMHRIFAITNTNNLPMRRFFENYLFVFEGVMYEASKVGDKYEDLCMYSMLSSDWCSSAKSNFSAHLSSV
eukprot:TRINITY_DN4057_c0_g1_i3.p1 TRINITY_DN4057_c0_g1~~TRINITY_DN4057_c0_g1_i3.p1  ORF type:complete len:173 (-),score=27.42 TRINITY_DN4057_c0_g1_i3:39-557(-)